MAADPRLKREMRVHWRRLRAQQLPCLQAAISDRPPALADLLPVPLQPTQAVGLTWPLAGEPDLRFWLQAAGVPLALPAVEAGVLQYRPWTPGQPLQPDACGIPAPPPRAGALPAAQLALLLVPALAIDRQGMRLGSGGGWYDRLRAQPDWRAVPALAVLPAACVVERLPADPWDVPFGGWLDEYGCHWIQPQPPQRPGRWI